MRVYQSQSFGIEGHQAFGVKLAEGNMQCPLFGSDVTQTVEWQVDAFSDADSGDARQQERIGIQVVGAAQFLLAGVDRLPGTEAWEIFGTSRKIFADDETGLDGMALGGQVVEQAAKTEQTLLASVVANRRTQLAKPAEPAQHMGIAAELGESADLGKGGTKIADEAAGHIFGT